MEVDQVLVGEGTDQRTHLVRVLQGERRVLHQRLHPFQPAGQRVAGLNAEPLIHHQRVVLEVLGEGLQRLVALGLERRVDQHGQCGQALGHVVGLLELFQAGFHDFGFFAQHQIRQCDVLQGATGEMFGRGDIGRAARGLAIGLVALPQRLEQRVGDALAGELACRMDGIHVRHFADFGQIGLARQREHLGDHRCIERLVLQQAA